MPVQYVVVGGGIAGVSCAEQLSFLDPGAAIVLVSSSQLIKTVTNFKKVSRTLEEFQVEESSASQLTQRCANVKIVFATALIINSESHVLELSNGDKLKYDKLCLCTGASPKLISNTNPRVVGIRDTQSVQDLQSKLHDAGQVLVVGNGGIATELIYEVSGCEIVWVIKDRSIGSTFFDEGAAVFFLPYLLTAHHSSIPEEKNEDVVKTVPMKRLKYMLDPLTGPSAVSTLSPGEAVCGNALGPDWSSDLTVRGNNKDKCYRHVHVEYQCEVARIFSDHESAGAMDSSLTTHTSSSQTIPTASNPQTTPTSSSSTSFQATSSSPLHVELTNGHVYTCDLVVSATGVIPNTTLLHCHVTENKVQIAEDGGVVVDDEMRTALPDVYAAGDVCTTQWTHCSKLWLQMRLWSQARQMGAYAAQAMVAHSAGGSVTQDFCFELFSHVTKFFGYKVILLGQYNAQGLGSDYELLLRCTKDVEYVKVILQHGRMVGAILIGETNLEETFENLILNQMDLSHFGESLLDPNIDIEDYFD